MKYSKLILLCLLQMVTSKEIGNSRPYYLSLDTGPGGHGRGIFIKHNVPDLSQRNFDNIATYACYNGVWLLYTDANYDSSNGVAHGFGDYGNCSDIPSNVLGKVSSVRYAGNFINMYDDTINFYQQKGFGSNGEYAKDDVAFLEKVSEVNSIVLTGCDNWTLFTENNYQGDFVCIAPKGHYKCKPTYFPDNSYYGNMKSVKSARRGCHKFKSINNLGTYSGIST